ncbi:MAG: serine hydrolase domain-containing protein [Bdellovibrionales bacterium]
MGLNPAERQFQQRLKVVEAELAAATPGFVLQAFRRGRLKMDVRWGRHYPYYDLASLTKIIFTATVCARAVEAGQLNPRDLVSEHWSEFPFRQIRMEQLWTHTAGLPWWRPFYKKLKGSLKPESRWPQISRELLRLKRQKSRRAVYSDPDLLVTSQVLQNIKQQNLLQIWQELACPEWTGRMHFNPGNKRRLAKDQYAPTEKCPWRKRVMHGQVHDENSFSLGGVAPHAGLFGRVEDVAQWGLVWRKSWQNGARGFLSASTARQFTRRHTAATVGDWGWLFMKPTAGHASCGRYFSSGSFGHTGFTGTSFWFDPRHDMMVVLLSNRVHPTRKNAAFLKWRPWLHDTACELLKR